MHEEKKYSIIGKVEIGTDEYIDLIETLKDFEKKYDDEFNNYWSEYNKRQELENKIKELEELLKDTKNQLKQTLDFIKEDSEIYTKYAQYKCITNSEFKDDNKYNENID